MNDVSYFQYADLEELLHLMQDQPAGRMVRTSKARAMFAMRACRKSVMVGKALTSAQMTTVSITVLHCCSRDGTVSFCDWARDSSLAFDD